MKTSAGFPSPFTFLISRDPSRTRCWIHNDLVFRTPLLIVGPGFAPLRRQDLTMHVDLMPTLLHAVSGKHVTLDNTHGRDLFLEAPPRAHAMIASQKKRSAYLVLMKEDQRLCLYAFLEKPHLTLHGFLDPTGQPLDMDLQPEGVAEWTQAFAEELNKFAPRSE